MIGIISILIVLLNASHFYLLYKEWHRLEDDSCIGRSSICLIVLILSGVFIANLKNIL